MVLELKEKNNGLDRISKKNRIFRSGSDGYQQVGIRTGIPEIL